MLSIDTSLLCRKLVDLKLKLSHFLSLISAFFLHGFLGRGLASLVIGWLVFILWCPCVFMMDSSLLV